ncbi:MAG: septation protein A [Zoogloeaceae bacterium]|jgi:intracellular septation protein|nr:septation protein A [Zoogloeaceae bacterium]
MKFLFDLFPVILFFATFKYTHKNPEQAADWAGRLLGDVSPAQAPILLATIVVMLATLAQIIFARLRYGKVEKMLSLSLGLVVVFGGMTLIFQNAAFIKWKFTLLYWAMAVSMSIAALCKRNAMRLILSDKVDLPEEAWLRLNLAWIGFFAFVGCLNLFVAYRYSTDIWMNFKIFGVMGLMLLFIIAQGVYLARFIKDEAEDSQT